MTGTKFYMDPPIFSPNRNYDRGYMSPSDNYIKTPSLYTKDLKKFDMSHFINASLKAPRLCNDGYIASNTNKRYQN